MKKMKNEDVLWDQVQATNGYGLRSVFQGLSSSALNFVFELDKKHVLQIKNQGKNIKSIFDSQAVSRLFGLNHPNHAFKSPDLDWGVQLTEPQITGALAHLLAPDDECRKAERVVNFVKSIGCKLPITYEDAQISQVYAELPASYGKQRGRIDLLLQWENSSKLQILAIEAKFGHALSNDQLTLYRGFLRNRQRDAKIDYVVLALDETVMENVKKSLRSKWRFVPWHGLWLQFERNGYDEDQSLSIFMRQLWGRINGFSQKEKK